MIVIIPSENLDKKTAEIMKNYGIVKAFNGLKI
jgi:hypothetical protein